MDQEISKYSAPFSGDQATVRSTFINPIQIFSFSINDSSPQSLRMPTSTHIDDYDSPWKGAVEHAFPEFIAFYFPDAHRQIDWDRGHTFLDKELQQITHDAPTGRRHVDKLVSVYRLDGEEEWVCVHIEIQSQHDPRFAERMFVYNYRIYDRHRRPVASLAVLADDDPAWCESNFGFEIFGCRHHLHYPVAKLTDLTGDHDVLLEHPNPFALVTAAHHLTRHPRRNPESRFEAKRRLVRLLYARNWDRERILGFFAVLDWMMRLPEDLENEVWHDIEKIEGERKVKYVTSVERLAIKRGMEKGMTKGLEKGRAEGRTEGGAAVLARQLNRRFGPLPVCSTQTGQPFHRKLDTHSTSNWTVGA